MLRASWAAVLLAITAGAQPLTQRDRDFAMSALHASRKAFLDATEGLTTRQASFKPDSSVWSIEQVAEHLAATEPFLRSVIQDALRQPEFKAGGQPTDEEILQRYANREQKAKAPPPAQPSGRFASLAASVDDFKRRRGETITYVQTTGDPLRAHSIPNFAGGGKPVAAYQVLLMIAAHTDRHVAQILEIKASKGYPKK